VIETLKRLAPIFCLFIILNVPGFSSAGGREDMTAATEALNRGDCDEAIRLFSQVLKSRVLRENTSLGYVKRGYCYTIKGLFDNAVEDYTMAIKLEPNNPFYYAARGVVYAKQEFFDRAIEDFSAAINRYPEYVKAYFERGNAYLKTRNYDNAIEDFTTVIKIDPEHINAYKGRGIAYDKKGLKNLAQRDAEQAKQLESASVSKSQ
jgi:tetratricopeptide (TPR) repeat protein